MMLRTALLAVMVFASAPVVEAQSPEHLTIGLADAVTSVDPHFYNATPNHNLAMHVFDRLVDRTAAAEPVPGLALSWQAVGEDTWEFNLRAGVRWHDGAPFTADDVAFTFDRARSVLNDPGGFAGMQLGR